MSPSRMNTPPAPARRRPALGLVLTPSAWAQAPAPLAPAVVVVARSLVAEGLARLALPLQEALGTPLEVLHAPDCECALALMLERPRIVLTVLDLVAGADDAALLPLLQARPQAPLLVLVGSCSQERALALLRAGARGVIPDSHPPQLVQGALELVLRFGGVYLPPEVFLSEPASACPPPPPRHAADLGLTPRQAQVLQLLLQGCANKRICRQLGVSAATVKTHLSAVLRALNVATRTQAVVAANRLGLVFDTPPPAAPAAPYPRPPQPIG
ncbi:conserved exported hypothetical protein [Rubrivivax sp. A210]|uniref:response regulator transcription factor n=1 Tax=Rubrivivax sp. A210 TaxID=2772301 RepID=UPI00191AE979|nr:response regulator transcription factor [Rubrivivax sp. A210]CAD5375070.1 conserved exported hypothetical protein [Rubrivivax sp. A210]